MAVPPILKSALVYIAQEKGYFKDNGINLELLEPSSGKKSVAALLEGRAQFAVSSRTPLTLAALEDKDFAIIASLGTCQNDIRITARKDKGIQSGDNLRGKKIGVQKGTSHQFFLELYLNKRAMDCSDANLVFGELDELQKGLKEGSLDALVSAVPNCTELLLDLGAIGLELTDPFVLDDSFLLSTGPGLEEDRDLIGAVLGALLQAEEFLRQSPEAHGLLGKILKMDPALLSTIIKDYDFSIGLQNGLVLAMKDEARWAMEGALVPPRSMPDYRSYIKEASLASLDYTRSALVSEVEQP